MTLPIGILVLLLLLALGLGAALGWAVASSRAPSAPDSERLELSHTRARLDEALNGLASANAELGRLRDEASRSAKEAHFYKGRSLQLDQQASELQERIDADHAVLRALTPITQKLGEVDRYVRALESATAERFTRIDQHLSDDAAVAARLARTTQSLSDALHHSSSRGSWGEVQLRRVIESSGMLERVDFDSQKASSGFTGPRSGSADTPSRGRPDVIVHLPNDAHIAIDAKAPMSAYLKAHEIPASDDDRADERRALLAEHARAVRTHVLALKKRDYPADFPDSPQVTVMFLPSEALLSEALDADPGLLDEALNAGIVLVSPASLLALLRSIAAVWRSAQATQEARDIVVAGRELVERLSVFVRHLEQLGAGLAKSVKSYNAAISSLESRVLVTFRRFDALGDKALGLGTGAGPLDSDAAAVRSLSQPEFLDRSDID
ncbi:DNA recombination protein RmuC [Actinomyces sp. B33]|uniref:DNA recombination protein RmuC n=1 Tax=Actinomyces sp. B33 TaxID=2942131 RepID=UPI002341A2D0|nr:DNA recombination protein RmuC [Actinomyces sp. B33]MDC4232608.1 DNA recombination protein RmuC [Actinomyces sp. B33]